MAGPRLLLTLSLVIVVCAHSVAGEIHRAKHTGKVVAQEPNFLDEDQNKLDEVDRANGRTALEIWVYTLAATFLVGLSGVFPLLVIPLRDDPSNYKEGTPGLQLLLSFAVGGLLGDVFLHLLPEAWAQSDNDHSHSNDISVGLWVIVGILSFLILEKIFADGETDESTTIKTQETTETEEMVLSTNHRQKTAQNLKSRHQQANGYQQKKSQANGKIVKNKKELYSNGHSAQNGQIQQIKHKNAQDGVKEKIKFTGYLNLFANCIDNFTHGLAVAASFLVSTKVGLLTTLAIMLHEIPHEIGDFGILLRSGFNRYAAAKAQVLTATGGVVGAVVTLLAESAKGAGDSTVGVLPFTAGGFIYIALVTVVPDLLKETNPIESLKQTICLCGGIAVMGLVTLIVD